MIVVDLNKYPYRIQTKQKLTVADKKDMAEKMAEKNQKFEWAPHSPDFSPQLSSSGVIRRIGCLPTNPRTFLR